MSDHHYVSAQNAPVIYALREKLFDLQTKRQRQKREEEETLKRLFEEAGGSLAMLPPGVSLSERAMAGLIKGSEGEANLQAFRQRHLLKH
jgi:hypothetical protein